MTTAAPIITFVSSLDWPSNDNNNNDSALDEIVIQCAGKAYLAYESRLLNRRTFLHNSRYYTNSSSSSSSLTLGGNDNDGGKKNAVKTKKEYDLLSLSSRKLEKLTYYQVLSRFLPMHATPDDIRRAYHKACLKYHPDKTGRGEEDAIFLLVKNAFDTLSDPVKRRSYDSTVDFDDSIPKENNNNNVMTDEEFFAEYGPVFERNLRFASFNDPMRQQAPPPHAQSNSSAPKGVGGGKNNKKKKNNSSSSNSGGGGNGNGNNNNNSSGGGGNNTYSDTSYIPPPNPLPLLGDNSTPLSQVHAFYEFWIHFDSWRDFTLKATSETEHDVESADCREEKRWMKQEIERKMKKMKREEMARINLLVTRAMACDPRLRREKERIATEKRNKEEAKKMEENQRMELEKKEREELELELAKKRAEEESKKKNEKQIKEQQKKQLRKSKQLFRKLTMAAYQAANPNDVSIGTDAVWDDLEKMNDDIELLSDKLSLLELNALNDLLGGPDAVEEGSTKSVCVSALVDVRQCAIETAAGVERQSIIAIQKRNEARMEASEKAREVKLAKSSANPWSKEELSALAKAMKKYPAGGSNRWDTIALFVNNLCKLQNPRSREECIEKYNQIASASTTAAMSVTSTTASTPAVDAGAAGGDGGGTETSTNMIAEEGGEATTWTEEQDSLLQEMLRKYPADMEKNERWKMISKGVPGKTKKECVDRFKAIREAVRQGKS